MQGFRHDFKTPEGAILCLEDAYRDKGLERAIACKDFHIEARLMMERFEELEITEDRLAKTAEVLELSFKQEIEQRGFPDMDGVRSIFPERKRFKDDIWILTEVCYYPDGGTSTQEILVAKTEGGWRVLNPLG